VFLIALELDNPKTGYLTNLYSPVKKLDVVKFGESRTLATLRLRHMHRLGHQIRQRTIGLMNNYRKNVKCLVLTDRYAISSSSDKLSLGWLFLAYKLKVKIFRHKKTLLLLRMMIFSVDLQSGKHAGLADRRENFTLIIG